MTQSNALLKKPLSIPRDLRIDAFRGLSLLMIMVDHIEWSNGVRVISPFTLHGISFCDAAEVFVFLSGYVCGISYGRLLITSGWWPCQRKAIWRAGQLYLANVATLLLVLLVVNLSLRANAGSFNTFRLDGMNSPPSVFWPRVFLQIYLPSMFDILVLYIFLLILLPLFLLGMIRAPLVTWYFVIQAYLVAQLYPELSYPKYIWEAEGFHTTTFTQTAWQLLFFVGAALGYRKLKGVTVQVPRSLSFICAAFVILIAIAKFAPVFGYPIPEMITLCLSTIQNSVLSDKWRLGPLRLVNFGILVIAVCWLFPSIQQVNLNRAAKAIIGCGQNSLLIFCLGILLSVVAHPVYDGFSRSTAVLVTYETGSCILLLILGAYLFHCRTDESNNVSNTT